MTGIRCFIVSGLLFGVPNVPPASAQPKARQADGSDQRMLIFLGQMEFARWIDEAIELGWAGDGFHSYRIMDDFECRMYFKKSRKHGQRVMLTLGDKALGYDPEKPGQIEPHDDLAGMERVARKNADLFWGWHCEGNWVQDAAVVNRMMDTYGADRLILYDNNLRDVTKRGRRQSRLWYPNTRKEPWPTKEQVRNPAFWGAWFADHPDVRSEVISFYPLGLLDGVRRRGSAISCWIAANGVPAEDPLKIIRDWGGKLGWLSHIYVQPRVDQMWFSLLACDAIGCRAAYFYTYSTSSHGWNTMSRVYPRLWHEMNEAVSAFKERRVPRSWKAKEVGRYVLEQDFLRVRGELQDARDRIAELEARLRERPASN